MFLNEINVGQDCTVRKVDGVGALQTRLMDFGITPGVKISVVKVAPLGDPIEVRLRGYNLSLRKKEAQAIEVD